MSMHQPDSSGHSVRGSAGRREKTGRDIVCKICQAVYVPAQTHRQLARSPYAVIESAFMSMCHFCFRCRQPACPSCWDDVHGVCGACALEAQLPFRSSVPPLGGIVLPPMPPLPLVRVRTVTPPLVCVRPGRFQQAPLPIEAQTTLYIPKISDQPADATSARQPSQEIPLLSVTPLPRSVDDITDIVTRPEKKRAQSNSTSRKSAPRRNRLRRTVMGILLLIVLLIALFIGSALLSPSLDDSIRSILHVDIRAEITYLLETIQHLF